MKLRKLGLFFFLHIISRVVGIRSNASLKEAWEIGNTLVMQNLESTCNQELRTHT